MSTDLFIYVPDEEPISHAAVHEAARKAGWHLLVVHHSKEIVPSDEPLKLGTIYDVYGAANLAILKRVRATLTKDSEQSLDRLYKAGTLHGVYVTVDEIEEPPHDQKFAKELEAAKLQYYVNGHGGKLQYDLWEVLARVTGGLMDDPQQGRIRRAPGPAKKAAAKKRVRREVVCRARRREGTPFGL